MVNGSQRGYLFGILQRGARPMANANRASQPLPDGPGAMQFFDPITDVNDSPEVNTPGESSYQPTFTGAEQSLDQPGPAADPQTYEPEQDSTVHATDNSKERPVIDAPSQNLSRPGRRLVDSSPQWAEPPAAESGNALLPIRYESQNGVTRAPQEMDLWERKIPRLIRTEHADKVVIDNSASDIEEARTDIANNEGQRRVLASPAAAVSPFDERGPSPNVVGPRSRVTSNNPGQPEMTSSRASGSVKAESIESVQLVRGVTVPLAEDLQPQKNAVPLDQSPKEESRKSAPAHMPEVVASAPSRTLDSVEPGIKVVLAQAQAEPREESLVWHPSPGAHAEERFTPAGRPQHPPYQPPREETPKLTINRLDVQIINQPAPPVQPSAPAAAAAPNSDGWEYLDRYYLGHLNAIF